MRAMIQAAGLGTRMRPLTHLCPKSALPVRGIPMIGYALAWLASQGVREVMVNLHHLPELLREAVEHERPSGLAVSFSPEPEPLGTGGGIRRARAFLRESDPCLVIAGDMLLDLELAPLVALHRARGDAVTLVLRDDPRGDHFGTIGLDGGGRVRRIARRLDLGSEVESGVYPSVRILSARALEGLPEREVFVDLDDWLAPRLRAGDQSIRGVRLSAERCIWEPVGNPTEYLRTNLHPPPLSYLDADARARARGVRFGPELVLGAGAELGPDVELRRVVVWDGEKVPAGLHARGGVFAGGSFHPCEPGEPDR